MWAVRVAGTPVPKPSPACFGIGGKHRLQLPKGSPGYQAWRDRCTAAGQALRDRIGETLDGPISARITYTLPRPLTHFGTGRNAGTLKPSAPQWPSSRVGDIDKLARLTLDALTDAQVWHDDAQVVHLELIKTYPGGPVDDRLNGPGAVIRVWRTPHE